MSDDKNGTETANAPNNLLELKQIVIDAEKEQGAELVNRYLAQAFNDLSITALAVMTEPSKATKAITGAQRLLLISMKRMIDPDDPCHFDSINRVSAANNHLENALIGLDSEANGKYIEDAILSIAKAIKAIAVARDKLKPKQANNPALPSQRRRS
jgi:hypothetical protein